VDHIAGFFHDFHMRYAEERGKERWADKTPTYARRLGCINELFPTCQVVHIIRNPYDVVASHKKRWGWKAARKATAGWSQYISSARAAASDLGQDRYYELRYEDLIRDPRSSTGRLCTFLGEEWDERLVNYDKVQHDDPVFDVMTAQRRRESADPSLFYASRVGSGRDELDPVLAMLTRRRTSSLAGSIGYEPAGGSPRA
jgi:hypothetical protein